MTEELPDNQISQSSKEKKEVTPLPTPETAKGKTTKPKDIGVIPVMPVSNDLDTILWKPYSEEG